MERKRWQQLEADIGAGRGGESKKGRRLTVVKERVGPTCETPREAATALVDSTNRGRRLNTFLAAALHGLIPLALELRRDGNPPKRAVRADVNGEIIGARTVIAVVGSQAMNARHLWSNIFVITGGIGMVVGAIDPMEGSLLILPASGLLAIGAYLGQAERRVIAYKVSAFVLTASGVAALWGLSAVGGFGGSSGHSMWWGLLILPYLIGWNMGIWGPGTPRWLLWLGIAVGLWYQVMAGLILKGKGLGEWGLGVVIATIGIVTLAGCIYRLTRQKKKGASYEHAIPANQERGLPAQGCRR